VTEAMYREWLRRPKLREVDVRAVAAELPSDARWATKSENTVMVKAANQRPRQVPATAIGGDYFTIKRMTVDAGRLITAQELDAGATVVVVGRDVAQRFFPAGDAVGKTVVVGNIPYEIVGVAGKQGSIFGISLDKFIIGSARSPLHRLTTSEPGVVDAMIVQAPTTDDMNEAREVARQAMRSRHKLRPSQEDNFSLESSESALEFWTKIKSKLVLASIVLPAIGLIVGALVIMNIMLVAVAERTREIGIRKSLGARRRDILAQFLVEAATLSTVGAAAGILLGVVIAGIIARVSPLPTTVAPWSLGVATLLGAGVGIAAGIYPASRAARLDPIAALRQE
jgi:putative ABC transport system permease protein